MPDTLSSRSTKQASSSMLKPRRNKPYTRLKKRQGDTIWRAPCPVGMEVTYHPRFHRCPGFRRPGPPRSTAIFAA
eukprot:7639780-Prorocentrum_lima.AAC.1